MSPTCLTAGNSFSEGLKIITDIPAGFCVHKSALPSNESSMTTKFIAQSKRGYFNFSN